MIGHGITKCSCGKVIMQCRCIDCGKNVTVVKNGCDDCKKRHALGPNVRRLICHKMSLDAVPAGGGLAAALGFLTSKERIADGARTATEWVKQAIQSVRDASAPNPYKDSSDEEIAGVILKKLDARMKVAS